MAVNAANLFAVECDSTVHFGKYSSGTPATLPTDLSAYVAPPGTATDTFTAGGGWVDAGALTDAPDFSQEFEILEKKVWNSCTTQYVCRQSTDRSVTVSIEELSRTSVEMMFGAGVWTTTTNGVRFVPTGGHKEYRLGLHFVDRNNRRFCAIFPRVGITEVSGPNADENCETMKAEITFKALEDSATVLDGVSPDMFVLSDFPNLVSGPVAL